MSPAENGFGLFTVTQCVVWLWVNLSQGLGQLRAILDTGCRRDFNRQGKKRSPPPYNLDFITVVVGGGKVRLCLCAVMIINAPHSPCFGLVGLTWLLWGKLSQCLLVSFFSSEFLPTDTSSIRHKQASSAVSIQ